VRAHFCDPAHRTELHALLAAARARLRPEDVGLPASRRHRPGLRREEVAELVGVSVRWYASFESGNGGRHYSAAFVQRVAALLRLSSRERVQLFQLALPEAATIAHHLQADAGRSISSAIYRQLIAEENLREAQVKLHHAQAGAGRALATAICQRLLDRVTNARKGSRAHLALVRKRDAN
jgi:transcriptional regulator with XRE-family HTH domain